jgi:tRNA (guanosine-2'-O-)-methyltransferase
MAQLRSTDLKRLHRDWRRRTGGRLAVVLDGVQSPFNVGAIVRTGAALRVETIFVAGNSTGLDHHQARRLSMGTERYMESPAAGSGVEAVAAARQAGYRVIGLELTDSARPLHELDLSGDVCLVVGNEDHGLPKATLAAVDACGYVPQLGKVGSLNVATAAAIALYEIRRQAWTTPADSRSPAGGEEGVAGSSEETGPPSA